MASASFCSEIIDFADFPGIFQDAAVICCGIYYIQIKAANKPPNIWFPAYLQPYICSSSEFPSILKQSHHIIIVILIAIAQTAIP